MSNLLDANVLVALAVSEHVHHERSRHWWAAHRADQFATCPITQGALVRLLIREGTSAVDAIRVLEAIIALGNHEFWPDDISYLSVTMAGVLGHRQVTDAYLAQLARDRSGHLVTLDSGLASLHDDVAVLIPADSGVG